MKSDGNNNTPEIFIKDTYAYVTESRPIYKLAIQDTEGTIIYRKLMKSKKGTYYLN